MLGQTGLSQDRGNVRPLVIVSFVAVLMSVASAAHANTVGMDFIGATGSTTLNVSDSDAGFTNVTAVIDPYKAYINGSTNPTLIWCIDPDHGVTPGQTWTANVSTISGGLGNTYLGAAGATAYGAMAWLITQFQSATTTTQKQELQAAIWEIAEGAPGSTGDFSVNNVSSAFVSAVATDVTNAEKNALTSGFQILTDTNGQIQEYIVLTPEPSTLLLLGAGLFALVLLTRSKKANPLLGYVDSFITVLQLKRFRIYFTSQLQNESPHNGFGIQNF